MKKKVCLLIYNLGSGGAEHVLSQWSFLLSEQYDIYMTVFDGETRPNYEYFGQLYNLNVKANNNNLFNKILIVLKRAYKLRKFVAKQKIDMVLSFCNEANLVNTISRHKARKVCSIRSVSDIGANVFVKFVIKAKKNVLILQTEALKSLVVNQYGEWVKNKIYVFGNPFDSEKIRLKSKELPPRYLEDILDQKITIVNVASIKPSKNHENLLRSFELVCNEIPDAYLLLVGADPVGRGEKIRKMVQQSKYADQVIFVGELSNPFSIVSRASIFALPSLAEGIPNVLAEAMICGIPVIASNCPTGPQELLTECGDSVVYNNNGYAICRYGVLVRPFSGSAEAKYEFTDENRFFANAIIDVIESDPLYIDLKQRAMNGAKKFDIEKYKKDLNLLITYCFEEK